MIAKDHAPPGTPLSLSDPAGRPRVNEVEAAEVVCVDLDGTLIAGDLLWEAFVRLCTQHPLQAIKALFSVWMGRAAFKQRVAAAVPLAPETLPYRQELLDELAALRQQGAHLVLATATDERYAHAVAGHLGLFADVVASDGRTNLSGARKAAALEERYGARGFHYLGNDWSDVPVWKAARTATAIAAPPRLVRHLTKLRIAARVVGTRHRWTAIARALRPHQWVKNFLVFVPLLGAHTILQPLLLRRSVLTFVAFCLCASAIYVLNDICDIEADRRHPSKRRRPFASGELSIPTGVVLAATLLAGAAVVSILTLSWPVTVVLGTYVVATSAYSLILKREPVWDVFTLTGLYLLRILGGGVATHTFLSSWLLGFALFIFLSLAFIKRYTELLTTDGSPPGRAYRREDALWMHAVGTSSGYMAVLVLALYINAPEVTMLYRQPQVLWCLCPLFLFWVTRLWFRASRREIHNDPVVEALTDWFSYVGLGVMAAIVLIAI